MGPKLKKAIKILKTGGTVVYPTETLYGLGTILEKKALKKMFSIKKREKNKPVSILVGRVADVKKYAIVPPGIDLKKILPGPVTVILKRKKTVPAIICKNGKIGIRVSKNRIASALAAACGAITATSANLSGKKAPIKAREIRIKADMIIDGGTTRYRGPSTVIDATNKKIIREGVVKKQKIMESLSWKE